LAAVERTLAKHLAARRKAQRASVVSPGVASRRAGDVEELWAQCYEGEGMLHFTPKGGRSAAAAARRGAAIYVCDTRFEGEAWRRLRLVGPGLDVRLGEGGLMEVEMPLEKVEGTGAFEVAATDLMQEASARERLQHGRLVGWAGGCALAWLVEKGRCHSRAAPLAGVAACGRSDRERRAAERRIRQECGLAVTAVRRAAGGRPLHAAEWDDLQWATASGAVEARRYIAEAVDEDARADLAAGRAMRCARHTSLSAGRSATRQRRVDGLG
jgi:hypothetical protein